MSTTGDKDNRLIVLTLISAYLEKNLYQYEAIHRELQPDEIIDELLKISIILAGGIAMAKSEKDNTNGERELKKEEVLEVIETLRKITFE